MRRSAILLFACLLACELLIGLAVKDLKFYKTLDISPDADEQTIKKAYKKQALKYHPDRVKDDKAKPSAETRFQEVAAAYEVLSDPEKRKLYDQFGEDGLQPGGPGGGPGGPGGAGFHFRGDPMDIFNAFFGGGDMGAGGGGGGMRINLGDLMGGMGGAGGMGGMGGGQARGGQGAGRRPRKASNTGEGLYDGDSNVLAVTPANFPKQGDKNVWLLEWYAPWCQHCVQLAPKWKKVARSLKGVVKVGAINCEQEKSLCSQHGVKGFPTIKALVDGRMKEYANDRSASSITDWALSLLPSRAVTVVSQATQVSELLEQSRGRRAAWDVCFLLFTNKKATAPLYKSLAGQYEGKAMFGEIRNSNKELAARFNVSSFPMLLAVCNGDESTVVRYKGEVKAEPLQQFIKEFSGGKKCGRLVRLDMEGIDKMKASKLKALLDDRGVSCMECKEIGDYRQRLKDLIGGGKTGNRIEL